MSLAPRPAYNRQRLIYFPNYAWAIKTTAVIRGKVKLITALDNRVRWLTGKEPAFRLADGAGPAVVLARALRWLGSVTSFHPSSFILHP